MRFAELYGYVWLPWQKMPKNWKRKQKLEKKPAKSLISNFADSILAEAATMPLENLEKMKVRILS